MAKPSDFPPAESFFPEKHTISALRNAAARCRACRLFADATQVVFGEGPEHAALMLVGEQPGNQEDLAGKPFVGPAGTFLDAVLAEVGLPREELYLTNVVKHFSFVRRGKLRIHKTPGATEVRACLPWLEEEIARVGPEIIVCLGATASRALVGREVRIQRDHGKFFETRFSPSTFVTFHPSALLRVPEDQDRDAARAVFVADLRKVAREYRALGRGAPRRAAGAA